MKWIPAWWKRRPALHRRAMIGVALVAMLIPAFLPMSETSSVSISANAGPSVDFGAPTLSSPTVHGSPLPSKAGASASASAVPSQGGNQASPTPGSSQSTGTQTGATCAPSPPNDAFDPAPSASGAVASPEVHFGTVGTELPSGATHDATFRFCVSAPGDVRVAVSVNTDSAYRPSNLFMLGACLTYAGGSCTPKQIGTQESAFFPISSQEFSKHALYEIRIDNPAAVDMKFFDIELGWTGIAHSVRAGDYYVGAFPAACVSASGANYLGCQAKFRWPTGPAGVASISVASYGSGSSLTKIRSTLDDKAVCDGNKLSESSPVSCSLPAQQAGGWWHLTIKKYSPPATLSPFFTLRWP